MPLWNYLFLVVENHCVFLSHIFWNCAFFPRNVREKRKTQTKNYHWICTISCAYVTDRDPVLQPVCEGHLLPERGLFQHRRQRQYQLRGPYYIVIMPTWLLTNIVVKLLSFITLHWTLIYITYLVNIKYAEF